MPLEDDIDFLDRIPTFHVLGREALRILAISAETVRIEGGAVLFEEGEPAEAGYVVINGALALKCARDPAGSAGTVARPGSLVGETALIVDTVHPSTATAMQRSTLLRIPREVFLRMLEGEPRAATALRRMISERVNAALNELDLILPMLEPAPDPDERDYS